MKNKKQKELIIIYNYITSYVYCLSINDLLSFVISEGLSDTYAIYQSTILLVLNEHNLSINRQMDDSKVD